MAYLVVNKNGEERIFGCLPSFYRGTWAYEDPFLTEKDYGVMLPVGTIYRLTGQEINFKHDPIDLSSDAFACKNNIAYVCQRIKANGTISALDIAALKQMGVTDATIAESINVDTFLDKICQQ